LTVWRGVGTPSIAPFLGAERKVARGQRPFEATDSNPPTRSLAGVRSAQQGQPFEKILA
jgi:hypothetical protein